MPDLGRQHYLARVGDEFEKANLFVNLTKGWVKRFPYFVFQY